MSHISSRIPVGVGVAVIVGAAALTAQTTIAPKAKTHLDLAAAAATVQDAKDLYASQCGGGELEKGLPRMRAGGAPEGAPAAGGRPTPTREQWHLEPVKVFDNLYFVGQKDVSAWAITTSDGIILMDALFEYSVEDEIVNGFKTLGLDLMKVKYLLVSHAHIDHYGGAKYLQDKIPGVRVVSSTIDWENMAKEGAAGRTVPKKDLAINDGYKLTLGDTTLTLNVTPGHTPGAISPFVPVKDHGTPHLAAEWGGTGFNTPTLTPQFFDIYATSAWRFRDAAVAAGADVIIGPHPHRDGSNRKFPILAARKAGDPHPYVVGTDAVKRFLTVAAECAAAQGEQLAAKGK